MPFTPFTTFVWDCSSENPDVASPSPRSQDLLPEFIRADVGNRIGIGGIQHLNSIRISAHNNHWVATTMSNVDVDSNAGVPAKEVDATQVEEEGKPPVSLWKFLGLAKPESAMLGVSVVLMITAEALGLYNPLLIAGAYNDLVDINLSTSERMSNINRIMMLALIIHFSSVLLGFLRSAIMGIAGERVVARTRNTLYSSILKQEIGFFDEHKTGELVSRLGSDAALLQQGTSQALPEVFIGVVKVLVSISIMFWISPKLAGVMIGFVTMIMVVCAPIGRFLGSTSKKYQDALGEAQTFATEALGAMRTVQSFTAESREEQRYRKSIGDPKDHSCWMVSGAAKTTYKYGFTMALTNSGFFTIIFGVGFGAMYITLWLGFKLVNDGEITLGELTAFQSYIFQIGGALGQTSQFITKLIQAQGAAGRIFDLLERVPAISTRLEGTKKGSDEENQTVPIRPTAMVGKVDFNRVSFSYPSRPDVNVLKDFSLSIPENTTAALVGSSGSGKSTIVSLLQRFYDVSDGSITIDGHDVRNLDLKWMRSYIAYVQQEPQLFGMSVKENIIYGMDHDVTQEEIEAAARDANAHDFIQTWPGGYDTLVGERGVQLSGGQKQRIAIARALLLGPRILLLDEATSALDSESEYLVQEAINRAVIGRTVLVVAHRLSTIQRAEKIVVLDNHAIVDIGTHEELMARCRKYQDLIKRQALGPQGKL